MYSCSSPVAAAIPSTAFPDTGTWHLTICTKKPITKTNYYDDACIDNEQECLNVLLPYESRSHHFKSRMAAVSMRCSSVRGGLNDPSRRNSKRYKRPVLLGVPSSSPVYRKMYMWQTSLKQTPAEVLVTAALLYITYCHKNIGCTIILLTVTTALIFRQLYTNLNILIIYWHLPSPFH